MITAPEVKCDFCGGPMPIPKPPEVAVELQTIFSGRFGLGYSFARVDLCPTCEDLLTVAELRRMLAKSEAGRLARAAGPVDPSQGRRVG